MLHSRAGATVVELLIALIIVTVGLLALAGAAAIVTRETAAGRRELALAWAARARLERLTSGPCDALADGSATAAGISERWTVSAGGNDTQRITVTVENLSLGQRTVRRLETVVPCA